MRMHWLRLPLQYQTRMVKGIASKWPGFSILYSTSKNIGPALAPIQAIPKITAGARRGFGIVYKGKLPDGGRDIAVKILKDVKGNGEEFINEIASMSRTSHVNVVSLLGFCYEENNKAIIYDLMPNGSLDKFIAENMSAKMEWETLYKIVVAVPEILEDGNETSSISNASQFERCTLSPGKDTLRISISQENIVQCPDS
ncbi:BnaA08g19750D [Brassica napus]|uniref:Protein kinase domain-containing protein n=2 Tax=Brassica TaxID=3705 RepID=M4DIE7_BRACM|nr:unnamed protein product [Brassica napus]CDY61630.1 BnaA08g19750D [Brassica napus]